MNSEIDKMASALLVVESALLAHFIYDKYKYATLVDISGNRPYSAYKKSLQKFHRRMNAFDAIVDTFSDGVIEIYVGQCDECTPPPRKHSLTTSAGHTIYFDISEFRKQ